MTYSMFVLLRPRSNEVFTKYKQIVCDHLRGKKDEKNFHQGMRAEPFLSTLQNMWVKSLQGVENFQQDEVLFVQAAYKFLHAAKMHFLQL